jgi:hypothetical protein
MSKELAQPREEIVNNVVVYISLCKLLASQNLKECNLQDQKEFLAKMKKGGPTFDQMRNVYPELRFESRVVLDKIFNSAIDASILETSLKLD